MSASKAEIDSGLKILDDLGLMKATKTVLKRDEFDALPSPQEKMKFIKRGGRVED